MTKAAILIEPGKPLSIEDVVVADCGPHEVRIRTAACGLCHSDLHFIDGAYPHPLPAIPGHEAAGIVEAVGSEVRTVKVGDAVVTCLSAFCGHCEFCVSGRMSLCMGGDVRIFGVDIGADRDAAMRLIGLVPQELNFNMFEKPLDILVNYAGFYGIPRPEALQRAEEELKRAQLWDKADKMSRTLSGGMKRRLMIARAMMTRPRLLILDEPTAGVDIEIRRGMWKTLKDINASGTTIILTTHYLEEAESLCRNLAIIDRGHIVQQGPMKALLAMLDIEGFLFDIDGRLPAALPAIEGIILHATDDHTLDVDMPREMDLNRVFAALNDAGIRVRSMRTKSNRLEELFVRLTGDDAAARREQAA